MHILTSPTSTLWNTSTHPRGNSHHHQRRRAGFLQQQQQHSVIFPQRFERWATGAMAVSRRRTSAIFMRGWFLLCALRSSSIAAEQELPFEACAEFASRGNQLTWTLAECMQVWSAWSETVPEWLHLGYPDRRLMKDVSVAMRERGQPCVVQARVRADGVGSEVTRHLAAWLYAKEIGCDWVTPNFGYEDEAETGPEGGTLYCHPSAAPEEFEGSPEAEQNLESCELVDWLQYFNLDETSVPEPDAVFHNVTGDPQDTEDLTAVLQEIEQNGLDSFSEDFRLRFTFHPSIGSRYTLALDSWDQYKRQIARDVLSQMRENFHAFPRPWYNEVPECGYKPNQLNFAMHVRMGDRRAIQGGLNDDYFIYLQEFMDDVTEAVVSRGLEPPMFHIYTQTLFPCPSKTTGLFKEFPLWPVEMDQIEPCLTATRPPDCPEKRAGAANCNADRSGIFKVQDMPLVLHVGDNVHECLSCMIQADGVLMGCSTFGHVVGLLTKGIRFFSVGCVGHVTPVQYRMIPPLAVAEYGHMYVPISGSWRNPQIMFPSIFDTVLTERLISKGWYQSGGLRKTRK